MAEPADIAPGPTIVSAAVRIQLRRLRDPQIWRLASGLVLFLFVLTHFLNHSLGLVSLEAMESLQAVRRGVWRSWPGSVVLYAAVAVHVVMVLRKFVNRRTWRLAPWEAAQIALGIAIPFLALSHVITTRGLNAFYGVDDTYRVELRLLWSASAISQSLLLLIVWLHATLGLHYWLRIKRWYPAWCPLLLVFAVMVPTLALTGWIEAARQVAAVHFDEPPMPASLFDARARIITWAQVGIWVLAALTVAAIVILRLLERLRSGPTIIYPAGRRVKARAGATLLEISRTAGVPHTSVCGGRGRCTTCRVLVLEGAETLAPPNPTEAAALSRIAAPPGVRLACQIRPMHALSVRPLFPPRNGALVAGGDLYGWGVEARITILFADLRGFTSLAEKLYPYDSVFLLNRYFEIMTQAITRQRGSVDKLVGDGIIALFGTTPGPGSGSREALGAAQGMLAALESLNQEFAATLTKPLHMGIGIHTGPAVLGRVGSSRDGLTALGDSVNIASRLEALNKEFGSVVILSEATLRASGLALPGAEPHEISVRGRAEPLSVHVVYSTRTFLRIRGSNFSFDRPADPPRQAEAKIKALSMKPSFMTQ